MPSDKKQNNATYYKAKKHLASGVARQGASNTIRTTSLWLNMMIQKTLNIPRLIHYHLEAWINARTRNGGFQMTCH